MSKMIITDINKETFETVVDIKPEQIYTIFKDCLQYNTPFVLNANSGSAMFNPKHIVSLSIEVVEDEQKL